MKVNIRLAAALVVAVTLASPVLAQRPQQTPEERAAAFDKADVNKDGKLDLAEFKTTIPEQMRDQVTDDQLKTFMDRRDTDKDGKLSKAEFTAPMQRPAQ
jgi:Ca2+-binding EF-hand superfamily protein